jgi:hypothetical protein
MKTEWERHADLLLGPVAICSPECPAHLEHFMRTFPKQMTVGHEPMRFSLAEEVIAFQKETR